MIMKRKQVVQERRNRQFRPFQVQQWQEFLEEARSFREKHGHCMISFKSNADPELARWAKRQRYQYKQYKRQMEGVRRPGQQPCQMTPERIDALNKIGFCWDTHELIWEERFNELKEFGRVHGHLTVPRGPRGIPHLASWVKCQRTQFKLRKDGKSYSITQSRIDRLEKLGLNMESSKLEENLVKSFFP